MACTNNTILAQISASSNAQYGADSAPRLIDGGEQFGAHFAANTDAAINTAPASTALGGFDSRAPGESVAATVDLGGEQCVQSVQVKFNFPSDRTYFYTVWTSTDGIIFTQQGGARTAAGVTDQNLWTTADIGGIQASHYQLRATGNSANNWVVINESRARGDQLIQPPNGFSVRIVGTGVDKTIALYGAVGANNTTINPSPALPAGNYSYTTAGPGLTSCTGTFVVEASDPGLVQRCITTDEVVPVGGSNTYTLADFDDGGEGTAVRFVVVQQPSVGSISVSADGTTLTVSVPTTAVAGVGSNGIVNIVYDTNG